VPLSTCRAWLEDRYVSRPIEIVREPFEFGDDRMRAVALLFAVPGHRDGALVAGLVDVWRDGRPWKDAVGGFVHPWYGFARGVVVLRSVPAADDERATLAKLSTLMLTAQEQHLADVLREVLADERAAILTDVQERERAEDLGSLPALRGQLFAAQREAAAKILHRVLQDGAAAMISLGRIASLSGVLSSTAQDGWDDKRALARLRAITRADQERAVLDVLRRELDDERTQQRSLLARPPATTERPADADEPELSLSQAVQQVLGEQASQEALFLGLLRTSLADERTGRAAETDAQPRVGAVKAMDASVDFKESHRYLLRERELDLMRRGDSEAAHSETSFLRNELRREKDRTRAAELERDQLAAQLAAQETARQKADIDAVDPYGALPNDRLVDHFESPMQREHGD
jgi:hypothetical protein